LIEFEWLDCQNAVDEKMFFNQNFRLRLCVSLWWKQEFAFSKKQDYEYDKAKRAEK